MKHLRAQFDALGSIKNENERWLGAVGRYYAGDDAVASDGTLSTASVDGVSNPSEHVDRVARNWASLERGTLPLTRQAPQAQQSRIEAWKSDAKPPRQPDGPEIPAEYLPKRYVQPNQRSSDTNMQFRRKVAPRYSSLQELTATEDGSAPPSLQRSQSPQSKGEPFRRSARTANLSDEMPAIPRTSPYTGAELRQMGKRQLAATERTAEQFQAELQALREQVQRRTDALQNEGRQMTGAGGAVKRLARSAGNIVASTTTGVAAMPYEKRPDQC